MEQERGGVHLPGRRQGRARGQGRGRGRVGRRRRGLRAIDLQHQQEQRRRERQERIRVMVENLDEQAMRALLRNLAERQPGLFLDIWELQPRAEGPARQAQPHWCECGKCIDMAMVEEELCCTGGQDNCLSDEPEMTALVLDPGYLDLTLRTLHDIFGMQGNPEPNRGMRHAAYRNFIMWQYGRMGQGNRQVVPSCCVAKIRRTYPSPNGNYTGYRPGRLV